MRLLVTGGAGYIGSHFCKLANSLGHDVFIYDNLSTGHFEFTKFGKFIEGDIRDSDLLTLALLEYKIEAVVHFAGKAIVSESVRDPDSYWEMNSEGTRKLLWAMTQAAVHTLIFSSSCSVYGASETPYLSEDSPTLPVNPYGESKLDAEEMVLEFAKSFSESKVAILRYFNVVGCDPEGEVFEKHSPETHLVPNILTALFREEIFTICGRDYPTRDGTCVRDFIDVNDLVKVHLAALKKLESEPLLISNVGCGRGYSVEDVIILAERLSGKELRVKDEPRRPGDPPRLVADHKFFMSWYKDPLLTLEQSLKTLLKFQNSKEVHLNSTPGPQPNQ